MHFLIQSVNMSVVPWSSPTEWLHVYACLKTDPSRALTFMQNWKARLGKETPVGVLATMTVLVALEEIRQTDQRNDIKLILLASGALTQVITE